MFQRIINRRQKWSLSKTVVSVDSEARSVTLAGKRNNNVTVGVEYIRLPAFSDDFSKPVQEVIDELDTLIKENLHVQNISTNDPISDVKGDNDKDDSKIGEKVLVY